MKVTSTNIPGGNENQSVMMDEASCPSAPSPGLVLFNTEDQSDIVFNVGTTEGDTWRFPAHSFVIGDASPVFEHIIFNCRMKQQFKNNLHGQGEDPKPEIHVHCQPETFHTMLRYIYSKEMKMNSITSALNLIPVSNQFELYELTRSCFQWIKSNVTPDNVLDIISFLRRCPPQALAVSRALVGRYQDIIESEDEDTDSDGDEVDMNGHGSGNNNNDYIFNDLIVTCCYILDSNAESILKSDPFLNLDADLLQEILGRDTLIITSELVIFESLLNYANHQCMKHRRPLTPDAKRDILGKVLLYKSCRYLTLDINDYIRGPYSSDLLTDHEKDILLSKLRSKHSSSFINMNSMNISSLMIDDENDIFGFKTSSTIDRKRTGLPNNLIEILGRNGKHGDEDGSKQTTNNNQEDQKVMNIQNKKKSWKKRVSNGFGKVLILVIHVLD